jgi:hypothetical protein
MLEMKTRRESTKALRSNESSERLPILDAIGTPYALHGGERQVARSHHRMRDAHPRRAEMKTLTIKDLPVTAELDSRAMSAVRGGYATLFPGYISMNGATLSMPFNPQQIINQTQTTFNQNGSNIAFAEALKSQSTVSPTQEAKNIANVNFGVAGNLA